MKKLILVASVVVLLAACALAQADLDKVLNLLDKKSETFRSMQADFAWDQFSKVGESVGEGHDIKSGKMYFRRSGQNVDVAADITSPFPQKMIFMNGVVELYTPKTGEVERHDAGKNRKSFESFLALGFGGRGSDLKKNFDLRYAGTETVNGKPTYKLELTPKTQEVKSMFPHITLWINQENGMSEQQFLDQGEGDYRKGTYTNIIINPPKLPPTAFDLKAK